MQKKKKPHHMRVAHVMRLVFLIYLFISTYFRFQKSGVILLKNLSKIKTNNFFSAHSLRQLWNWDENLKVFSKSFLKFVLIFTITRYVFQTIDPKLKVHILSCFVDVNPFSLPQFWFCMRCKPDIIPKIHIERERERERESIYPSFILCIIMSQ